MVDVTELQAMFRNTSGANGQAAGIGFATGGPNLAGAAIIHERTSTNSEGKLHFATNGNGNSGYDIPIRVTIDNDGKMGIGTQAPSQKLHVEGSIQMVDGNQTAGYIPVSDANGTMTWTNPGTLTVSADEIADGDGDTHPIRAVGGGFSL